MGFIDRPAASAALGLGWGVVLFGILGHLVTDLRAGDEMMEATKVSRLNINNLGFIH